MARKTLGKKSSVFGWIIPKGGRTLDQGTRTTALAATGDAGRTQRARPLLVQLQCEVEDVQDTHPNSDS